MGSLLTRYWFVTDRGYGVGVTAYSLDDAYSLIGKEESLKKYVILEVIEDVDIRSLDLGHVIPNMLPANVRGVWFPLVTHLF